jgi:hypothetical protein
MPEITYLPEVECVVSPGFLDREVTVGVPDESGNRQFLRVNKGLITQEGSKTYLAVGVVDVDYRRRRVLIELPHEADSGANRLWVPFAHFRRENGSA